MAVIDSFCRISQDEEDVKCFFSHVHLIPGKICDLVKVHPHVGHRERGDGIFRFMKNSLFFKPFSCLRAEPLKQPIIVDPEKEFISPAN